jgi:TrmH RNA methyltransferase
MSHKNPQTSGRFNSASASRSVREPRQTPDAETLTTDKPLRITGYPAVAALFRTQPDRVVRFFYEERMIPRIRDFCACMAGQRRPYRMLDTEELSKVAGTIRHGGIVAVATPRPLSNLSLQQTLGWARSHKPLFVLDGIGNTHNLGAIARTLAFFGHEHLILSDHPAQAGLSDSAYRVAEGGLEYLEVFRANRLPALLHALQPGYRIVGTALDRGIPLEELPVDPRPPLVLLGNEELGLPPATLKACESIVRIQGKGVVQSLNVSATVAILAYALAANSQASAPRPAPAIPHKTRTRAHPAKRPRA